MAKRKSPTKRSGMPTYVPPSRRRSKGLPKRRNKPVPMPRFGIGGTFRTNPRWRSPY